jgi:hypothetical protein
MPIHAAFQNIKSRVAYLDTLEIAYFKPELPAAADRFHTEEIIDRDGVLTGYRIIAGPAYSYRELMALDRFQGTYGGKLYRVHVACDFIINGPKPSREYLISPAVIPLREYLLGNAVIAWRRKGKMYDDWEEYSGECCWCRYGLRRPNRNLVLYNDRPSKLTGETPIVHLELRFERTATCKRQGWHKVSDLFDTDPHEIFGRNIRLATNVQDLLENIVARNAGKIWQDARDKWIGKGKPKEPWYVEPFRSYKAIAGYQRGGLMNAYWHRAQVLRHTPCCGHQVKLIKPGILEIPHRLTWIDDALGNSVRPRQTVQPAAAHTL